MADGCCQRHLQAAELLSYYLELNFIPVTDGRMLLNMFQTSPPKTESTQK